MGSTFSMKYINKMIEEALKEASISLEMEEVPVGAIIVNKNGEIIGRGHNDRENTLKIHGHAEINAINDAIKKTNTLKLTECTMFVTLEPCPMCAGAIISSGIENLFYGQDNEEYGSAGSKINLLAGKVSVFGGIKSEESKKLIKNFFKKLRK